MSEADDTIPVDEPDEEGTEGDDTVHIDVWPDKTEDD